MVFWWCPGGSNPSRPAPLVSVGPMSEVPKRVGTSIIGPVGARANRGGVIAHTLVCAASEKKKTKKKQRQKQKQKELPKSGPDKLNIVEIRAPGALSRDHTRLLVARWRTPLNRHPIRLSDSPGNTQVRSTKLGPLPETSARRTQDITEIRLNRPRSAEIGATPIRAKFARNGPTLTRYGSNLAQFRRTSTDFGRHRPNWG